MTASASERWAQRMRDAADAQTGAPDDDPQTPGAPDPAAGSDPADASPGERWAQRMLNGLGARPVGHADPDDDDPQTPATPPPAPDPDPAAAPAPAPVQKAGQTITDWWCTQPRPEIGPDTGKSPDDGDEQGTADDQDDTAPDDGNDGNDGNDDEDDEDDDEPAKPTPSGPTPTGPVSKTGTGTKRRARRKAKLRPKTAVQKTAVREPADPQEQDSSGLDPRLRILLFNSTAAAVGYSFGLVGVIAAYMPVAEQAAVGTFGLVLAVGGAWGVWKLAGHPAVQHVLPFAPLSRILLTGLAAEGARRLAPVPVAYLNTYGQHWGLGPSTISLLITAGGICGALWWALDRHVRRAHWGVRWVFRIPLASALLACLPYTGVPVV